MKVEKLLTKINFASGLHIRNIKYLVIHYFGDLGTAKGVAEYFFSGYRNASAHYSVDERDIIYQIVHDADISWHCGTTGIHYHPDCCNTNSIGIEMRPDKVDKTSKEDDDTDWYFNEKTVTNTIELIKCLMTKHNIPIGNVLRHYDITHKLCPRPFVGDDINDHYKITGNKMWENFKERIQNGGDNMDISSLTDDQIDQLIKRMNERLYQGAVSDYAKEASQNGVISGVFSDGNKDGLIDNPQGFVKRQDLAVVLNNIGLLKKKG